MKRLLTLLLAMIVMTCTLGSLCAFAAENHGQDAHSPSMSVESGEEPITDKSTTKEPKHKKDAEVAEIESEDADAADEDNDIVELDLEAGEEQPIEEGINEDESNPAEVLDGDGMVKETDNKSVLIGIVIGIIIVAAVVILVVRGKKKKNEPKNKKDGKYYNKH